MTEREHSLKCWPNYWEAIACGDKNFEVRRDDRGFQKGDVLLLKKYDPKSGTYELDYSGLKPGHFHGLPKTIRRVITYVLTGGQMGIEAGYVVLGLAHGERAKEEK